MPAVSLDDVARRAGVTVQTVIRRFGGKGGLMAAAGERESTRVGAQRDPARVAGDLVAAIDQLVSHYEEMGGAVLRMLAAEAQTPELTPMVDTGRRMHRAWCETVFGSSLRSLDKRRMRRRLAEVVAVCDIQTWKLLRLDAGLSERETRLAVLEMLRPLLEVS